MKWQQPANVHELEKNNVTPLSGGVGRERKQSEIESVQPNGLDEDSEFSVILIRDAILKASKLNAKTIYIESENNLLRIRFRSNGKLTEELQTTGKLFDSRPFVQALVADRKTPLGRDATVSASIDGQIHEITLLPLTDRNGFHSLTVKLRTAPRFAPTLDELGMPVHLLRQLRSLLDSQCGLLMICSSDSHNLSTTRQAVLQHLNSPTKKIIDLDSVQHHKIPRITSLPLPIRGETAEDLSYKLLDHEPDVIGTGVTEGNALLQALIGVVSRSVTMISGVKTDSALSGIKLLLTQLDLNQTTSVLSGVLAQQTLVKVCPDCKAPHKISDSEAHWINTHFPGTIVPDGQLVEGEGCASCYDTGSSGTCQVYELVKVNDEMRAALEKRDLDAVTTALVLQDQFESIKSRAFRAALRGEVSLRQVMLLK